MKVFAQGAVHVVSLHLPFAADAAVDVARKGEQLFVTVGPYKRVLLLPHSLVRRDIVGAELRDGRLEIRFGRADAASA